jgi:multidrug transporter EmrE-like cation transporter
MFSLPPEFFDIFGLMGFAYIIAFSLFAFTKQRAFPKWMLVILLLVGVMGLIVDGVIVYTSYII